MKRPRLPRRTPGGRPRRTPGWLSAIGWLALLLGSLLLVTWRQTRGLELEAALRQLETAQEMAEAEKVQHERGIQRLRSRARVVQVARDRLRMRLAVGDEIVFLPAVAAAPVLPTEAEERLDLGAIIAGVAP